MRMISRNSRVVLAVLFLASCDDDGPLGPSSTVEAVAVIPSALLLVAGDSLQLTTIARGDVGNPLVGRSVTWESSLPSVATVSKKGVVQAVASGAAFITATVDGKTGSAQVTVITTVAFASVVTGGAHTCGRSATGTVQCWGRGETGQLGVSAPVTTCLADQMIPCALVPLPITGSRSFTEITAGGMHTCGLTNDGSAWCWGANSFGQLGDGTLATRTTPVSVATTVRFTSLHAGGYHTCGLTDAGAAWCWGRNDFGQLADGTVTHRSIPVQVNMPVGVTLSAIAGGGTNFGFSCALSATGAAYCWGANFRGQLGRGIRDVIPHPQPELVSGGLTFTSMAVATGDHVCALTVAGAAYCWGGGRGVLGDGSIADSYLPVAVAGGITFAQVTVGGFQEGGHSCGLTSSGAAYCWGDNAVGAVGDGTAELRRTPVAVAGGLAFESIDAGFRHTCGRIVAGAVYCWGSGSVGQLGTNSRTSSALPVKVLGQS